MELRTIIDDDGFRQMIADTAGRMRNVKPAMLLVGNVVCESIDENFAAEGRPDAWQALSDNTVKPDGWNILEGESKRLREGIHVDGTGNDFVDVAPDELPYARIQHLGGQAGPGRKVTIPAREYMVLQEKDADRIEEIVADFILRRYL